MSLPLVDLALLLIAFVAVAKLCNIDQTITGRSTVGYCTGPRTNPNLISLALTLLWLHAATVGVVTETNAEKAIEELKAYEVSPSHNLSGPNQQ